MKTYYLDTSALVKLYHQEKGTGEVEKIFSTENATIIISEIAVVELYSALYKLNRLKEISKDAVEASIKSFEEDCRYRFSINPASADEFDRAKELIKRYGEDESSMKKRWLQSTGGNMRENIRPVSSWWMYSGVTDTSIILRD